MKKTAFAFIFLLTFCAGSYSLNIPVFNMPPNNYKLFSHKEAVKTEAAQSTQQESTLNTNSISISGIFKSGGRYFVLINHKVYKEGDEVDGYKVEKIENNCVTFIKDGVEIKKTLNSKPGLLFFSDDIISNDNDSTH